MENNDQNLQTIDLGTLKALAYDTLRFIEVYQVRLRAINEQIMKREKEEKEAIDMAKVNKELSKELTAEEKEEIKK